MCKILLNFLWVGIVFFGSLIQSGYSLRAQNIVTNIGSINSLTCAIGDTLVFPVSIQMASNIQMRGFQLSIAYDTTKLQCLNLPDSINSSIQGGFVSGCDYNPSLTARRFRCVSTMLPAVNFSGLLFRLKFKVLTPGTSNISFDTAAGGCEFVDNNIQVIGNCTYQNGILSCGPPCNPPTFAIQSPTTNSVCFGDSVLLRLSAPQPGAQIQWFLNGLLMPGANQDSLWASQTGGYSVRAYYTPYCYQSSQVLNVRLVNCNSVSGRVRYQNNSNTPLAGVPVYLRTLALGNVVASDTTDSSGFYSMEGFPDNQYRVTCTVPHYRPGGLSSVDALLLSRYRVSLYSLNNLQVTACDFNGNSFINSGDALLILRWYNRLPPLTPPHSDFVATDTSFEAMGSPRTVNLWTLGVGDVNGSFMPSTATPNMVIDTVLTSYFPNTIQSKVIVRFDSSGSGAGIYDKGICWATTPNPVLSGLSQSAGSGSFNFEVVLNQLNRGQTYYLRAYAKYGNSVYYSTPMVYTIPAVPTLGSIYAGGVLFYIDGSGQHGLVCDTTNLGIIPWGCPTQYIAGTSYNLGTGSANTVIIRNSCLDTFGAAYSCDTLNRSGYDDWFLPSVLELASIRTNLIGNPIANLQPSIYWSSSHDNSNNANRNSKAVAINFGTGFFTIIPKTNPQLVRAIRAF